MSLPKQALSQLQAFIRMVKTDPDMLHSPDLSFFKQFIESFGGVVPPPTKKPKPEGKSKDEKAPPHAEEKVVKSDEEDIVESDVELDESGVIEGDVVEKDVEMPDISKEVSEEDADKADEKKMEAMSAYGRGDYEQAAVSYTEAIKLNPGLSLLYAKRGQCHLQMKKPNACILDCTRALSLNPDNAAAYKFRGRAHRLLGHWLEAVRDLRSACKFDFDDQADEWLKEVTPNARKLEEHARKYERLRNDKEMREKWKRAQRVREEHAKAAKANYEGDGTGGGGTDKEFPMSPEMMELLKDPEFVAAIQDPEVSAAFTDIMANPENFVRHMNNPKVMELIRKFGGKAGGFGFGGMGGGSSNGTGGGVNGSEND